MNDRRLCAELHSRGHVALARLVALRLLPTAPSEDEKNTSVAFADDEENTSVASTEDEEDTSVASAEDLVDSATDTASSVDEDIPETSLENTESDVEEPPAPAWVAHFDGDVLRYLLPDALLP
ncbi:hypothetical protein CYMTET_3383 [Cymbomonas tetramitiformis]|uniref:Uncharacterized protein n=1 Tax=Cymbomonas tetramitiformis TaxID=36881 RepID=A0AAE0H388_9CHLO|nr:hypothetical protein CYMTET_38753 [Cymbomonas tetramitiformis]KAK3289179.1 hypothetical protein CYMTET_3383 [Cymbomonas tetramitiformis]